MSRTAGNGMNVEMGADGLYRDEEGRTGYGAHFSGGFVCYTCGVLCDEGVHDAAAEVAAVASWRAASEEVDAAMSALLDARRAWEAVDRLVGLVDVALVERARLETGRAVDAAEQGYREACARSRSIRAGYAYLAARDVTQFTPPAPSSSPAPAYTTDVLEA